MYRDGDNFVRTVLTYGLLLKDNSFAQEFFLKPIPSPDRRAHLDQESLQERARSRLFFFIRNEELEDARSALSSLAVATSRTILEQLNELPAGKNDLVESLSAHFGEEISGLVQTCLAKESPEEDLFRLQAQLSTWQSRFDTHAAHLKTLLAGFYGPPQQFEAVCLEMLSSLYPQIREAPEARWLETDEGRIVIECKSLIGKFGQKQLRSGDKRGSHSNHRVIVVNHMREVPLLSRSTLAPALKEEAEHQGMTLLDSRDLWREHNSVLVADQPTSLPMLFRRAGTGKESRD
jgi:hypothetical protein